MEEIAVSQLSGKVKIRRNNNQASLTHPFDATQEIHKTTDVGETYLGKKYTRD